MAKACRHGFDEWADCAVCGPAINKLIRLLAERAVSDYLAESKAAPKVEASPATKPKDASPKGQWLSADECATYFGLKPTKKGEPNRRGFLERLAALPDFPQPLVIGNQKTWKLSEIEDWAEDYRRVEQVRGKPPRSRRTQGRRR